MTRVLDSALNEAAEDVTMRIVAKKVSDYPHEWKEVGIEIVNDKQGYAVFPDVQVYCISGDEVAGYIPSKVLRIGAEWYLVYYVNPALPGVARPFGDKCYMFAVKWEDVEARLEYDATLRVFIDQVVTDDGVYVIFMAGENEYKALIGEYERKIELEGDLAIYKEQ